jgi:hypothetical protein
VIEKRHIAGSSALLWESRDVDGLPLWGVIFMIVSSLFFLRKIFFRLIHAPVEKIVEGAAEAGRRIEKAAQKAKKGKGASGSNSSSSESNGSSKSKTSSSKSNGNADSDENSNTSNADNPQFAKIMRKYQKYIWHLGIYSCLWCWNIYIFYLAPWCALKPAHPDFGNLEFMNIHHLAEVQLQK